MEKHSEERGNFDGFTGGAVYDLLAGLTGYGPRYYRRAAAALPIRPGMSLVDLGCGTGSLTMGIARRTGKTGRVVGIDIAEKQLARARAKLIRTNLSVELRQNSIEELPFEDDSIDGISMSQVIHALPEEIRDAMISGAFRILKPGGFFGLIEWSRPGFGYSGIAWGFSLRKYKESDNWRGTYPAYFVDSGFELESDRYLDSLNRCQIFRKPTAS